ncbi:MAG TPA: DUF1707 domain-containing protein [Streptosporangiaceae bacterium]|nr:DUF1707 domain-containing protein [Streptosporangiaceae bacterium]
MTSEPGSRMAAAGAGRGRLRAARADREQVIDVLKAGFVQGRLTKEEFDARVSQTFASRTYAELAVITADIPVERAAAKPRRTPARTPKPGVAWSTGVIIAAVVLVSAVLTGNDQLIYLAVVTVFGAAFATVGQLLYSRHERRFGRPPPPRRGPALEGKRVL